MLHRVQAVSRRSPPHARVRRRARLQQFVYGSAAALSLLCAADGFAQDRSGIQETDSPLWEAARRVALDPTTYAPTAIVYTSRRLDWSSSQPLFGIGYVEANARYTTSGLPFDTPVTFSEGNRRIARETATLLGQSVANNAVCSIVERMLINRAPKHRKLIRTLGWIERVSFASYWSYRLSARHFEQWRTNERLARQLGAR